MAEEFKHSSFPLLFVVGPTAVGKTRLSLFLAARMGAALLNCDSVQMFKGLNIGSAKPDFKRHKGRVFLYDKWTPPHILTAGEFREQALEVLKRELKIRPVVAVGGSGFYIQALEKGMYPVKQVPSVLKQKVYSLYKKKGIKHLYFLLKVLDPEYACSLPNQDAYRVIRALCLVLSEERSMAQIRSEKKDILPYPVCKVGLYLPRHELLKKVETRTRDMLKAGLLEETAELLKNPDLKTWPVINSVGYKECVACLNRQIPKSDLKHCIVRRTMQLAKKQMRWFKRDKKIHWYLYRKNLFEKIYQDINIWWKQNHL